MENSLKGLILAAGVIITCVVIGLGFYIAREAKDTAADGASEISSLNAEFSENDKTIYDGLTVSGNEVLNSIRKFKNDAISVKVITKKSTTYYINKLDTNGTALAGKSSISLSSATNIQNSSYINPNGKFQGTVLRDNNNTIIGIEFKQV